MIDKHPKLEYLRSKQSELKEQLKKVQAELEAVVDVTIKDQYENRLNLLFQQIEAVNQDVERLQRDLQGELIKREVTYLVEILQASNGNQWEILQQSYYTTLSHWISRVQRNVENVQAMVSELNKIAQGIVPYTALEEFIAHLIHDTSDAVLVNALKQWGIRYYSGTDWLQLYAQIRDAQDKRLEAAHPAILMTITRCDEASTQAQEDETYYRVNAWLVEDIETYRSQSRSQKTGYHSLLATDSPETAPSLLEELLPKIAHLLNHFLTEQKRLFEHWQNYPQMHVFLPLELMHLGVDLWPHLNPENSKRREYLGHDHIVVIRCANRYDRNYKKSPSWLKLWNRHQGLLQESARDAFVPGHDHDLDELMEILDEAVQPASNVVGLHVTQVPLNTEELFYELLDSGLPLAIWPRSNLVDKTLKTEVGNLLDACCLERLPHTVKDKRYETRQRRNSPDCHIGHHLSLLWDDPYLAPPKSA